MLLSKIFWLTLLARPLQASTASLLRSVSADSPDAGREQVRLSTGWRFWRSENIPDGIIYERRSDASNESLLELKPWILPMGNAFINDPEDWHDQPDSNLDIDIEYTRSGFDDSGWENVTIPHDWAIRLPFLTGSRPVIPTSMGNLPVHGVGWYRKQLDLSAEDARKKIYLDVDGAMAYPMVWVNGKLAGGWPFGYNSFRVDITPHIKTGESNILAIRAENPAGRSSRWYPGAGLYRNVWLTKVSPVHVAHWGTFISSREVSDASAVVDLSVTVENRAESNAEVLVLTEVFEFNTQSQNIGRSVAKFEPAKLEISATDGKASFNGSVTIRGPHLWGPPPAHQPNLYAAVTRVYQGKRLVDEYETKFGIRSLEFHPDNGLLVNGQKVYLQGVNQHHDLGPLGAAFNVRAARRQLEMLRDLGANAIRMSHNPPAPELLELTDEMGFLVINEIFDSWEESKTPLDYSLIFQDWREPDLRAFIRRDRNHPSVIVWSYGNEVKEQSSDDERAAEIAIYLRNICHAEDPTRPTSTSMHFSSPNMTLPTTQDVISLNYQGEGMRYGPAYEHITGGNHKTPQYQAYHDAFPDKLIMGSEVAPSLSTRGAFLFPVTPYNSAPVNDSYGGNSKTREISAYELYTADAGSSADRIFMTQDEKPFVSGGFVWTGWDYLGEPYKYSSLHTGGWGIIDLAGFKKERFWLYQSRWRPDLKMAHIIPHWNWPGREGEVTPVHVFSAADEAELFLNGQSQGRLKKGTEEYRFRWDDVKYEPGELYVQTYKGGSEWAADKVQTTLEAYSLHLSADRGHVASDGDDLVFVTMEVVDAEGKVVPKSNNTAIFSVSGPGEIVATTNGNPGDFTAFTSLERRAFNGLALAIVRSYAGASGELKVRATSEGLQGTEISIEV